MLKTENRITIKGIVTNFKPGETKQTKKKKADMIFRVLDNGTESYIRGVLYDRKNLKINKEDTTLGALESFFLDKNNNNKSRNVKVYIYGNCDEFVNDKGELYENHTDNGLYTSEDEDDYATFNITGFVDAVNKVEDDEDELEFIKIKIGFYSYRNKQDEVSGVQYKTVYVRGEKMLEKFEDVNKGDYIEVKGDIISSLSKKDKYGDYMNDGVREYQVHGGIIRKSQEDVEKCDQQLYKEAKKLKQGDKNLIVKDFASNEDDE